MSATPSFVSTPKIGRGKPSVANTNRDGTGTITDILTGGASGSRVDRVEIQLAGTTGTASTANVLRLYISDGATYTLLREIAAASSTPSASAAGYNTVVVFPNGIFLPSGYKIACAVHAYTDARDAYVFTAFGGDL